MTTSVYLHLDVCPHCGRSDNPEGLHVGQSASGFHGYLTGDPNLPVWWDGPVATFLDWTRFAQLVVEQGARWSDNNENRLADPATTVAEALAVIGPGPGMADWYRNKRSAVVVCMHEADPTNLPTYKDAHLRDRMWWVADGYTFQTGDWS